MKRLPNGWTVEKFAPYHWTIRRNGEPVGVIKQVSHASGWTGRKRQFTMYARDAINPPFRGCVTDGFCKCIAHLAAQVG